MRKILISHVFFSEVVLDFGLDDGRLLLDNNLAENEIRPITLGRKNYLFCGNHESAQNMCVAFVRLLLFS